MNSAELSRDATIDPAPPPRASEARGVERMLRARVVSSLADLRGCRLTLVEGERTTVLGHAGTSTDATLEATVRVHDPAFYRAVALNGSVGAGEAYMDGLWDCSDLVTLVRMLVLNRDHLDRMEGGLARIGGWAMRAWSAATRNTRAGSRRNIAAHYDLGNDLFALFLDDNLMYSSAMFAHDDEALEVASTRKLERVCHALELGPQHRVLEIGTGWGGFALHAARTTGCHVTTTTISREQAELARARIAAAGLSERVEVIVEDYRDLRGQYDRLVSIEMIEAIGHQYLDTYFGAVGRLLVDDGKALIQAITIEDHRYAQALKSVDFIKRHVFPGSFIPSVAAMTAAQARASDLRLLHLDEFGPSYALTLKAWRERFMSRLADVRALGYPPRFVRLWEFYLAYCEGGFRERSIGVVHLLLGKPRAVPPQVIA